MDAQKGRPFYWEPFIGSDEESEKYTPPPGHQLAALRRGAGREPGTVPEMWTFYTRLNAKGELSPSLIAEHHSLVLFGIHQQGERMAVHWPKVPIGAAVAVLSRKSEHSTPEAIEQRFTRAVTAADVREASFHLRGLIQLLKTLNPTQGFDYTMLFDDLRRWQNPQSKQRIQRAWGTAFYWNLNPHNATDKTTEKE